MELSESNSPAADKTKEERKQTIYEWFKHLKKTYGFSVLAMISFVYFSMGFRVLLGLTIKDLFKTQLKLQPAESQIYTSIIDIPWSMKFLVGIFVDNWKVLGKDQRNYLKIWGLMMWFSLLLLQVPFLEDKIYTAILLISFNLFNVLGSVASDAIMVIYARRDPVHGSSDLQTFHVFCLSIGGIAGSISSSYANEKFSPYHVLSFIALISFFYFVLAFWIDEIRVEKESIDVWTNLKASINHLRKGTVFKTLIYMLISAAILPSFPDIMYYWMINVLQFSKEVIALLTLIGFITAIAGPLIYNWLLKNLEFRTAMLIAHVLIGIAIIVNLMLVTRFSRDVLGINDVLFSIFTDSALEILYVAFVFMPSLVVQTKIIPKNVEATVYSLFTSMNNFTRGFVSPMFGGIIAGTFNVTNDNFENLKWLLVIELIWNTVPLCLLWLLPSNKELDEFSQLYSNEKNEDVNCGDIENKILMANFDRESSTVIKHRNSSRLHINKDIDS